MVTDDMERRRVRLVYIDPQWLLRSYNNMPTSPMDCWNVPTLGLPEGFTVQSCNYDPARMAFAITIHHPSFEPVKVGSWVPEMEVVATFVPVWKLMQAAIKNAG